MSEQLLNPTIPNADKLTDDDVILVTGGTGLFGKGVEAAKSQYNLKGKWIFLSSKDGDLRDKAVCDQLFAKYKPTYVLHLAAFVGGLFRNMKFKAQFWLNNVNMNNNILQNCYDYDVCDLDFFSFLPRFDTICEHYHKKNMCDLITKSF